MGVQEAAQRIGVLGGTFNPIHRCHVTIARACRDRFRLDRVELIPCGRPPHKRLEDDAAPEDRLAMVRLSVEGEPGLVASDREIRRPGPSYTVDTLGELRRESPGAELYFIIGADTVPELPTWRSVETIFRLARIVTVVRPGYEARFRPEVFPFLEPAALRARNEDVVRIPPCPASATEIRRAVREGRPFGEWVADRAAEYIRAHGLYGARARREGESAPPP
jgi:nicotinate-nucleotide adenylyltransferase